MDATVVSHETTARHVTNNLQNVPSFWELFLPLRIYDQRSRRASVMPGMNLLERKMSSERPIDMAKFDQRSAPEADLRPPPRRSIWMKIAAWFDASAEEDARLFARSGEATVGQDGAQSVVATVNAFDDRVDVLRIIPFIGVHLMCLGVFFVGWSWFAVGVGAAFYVLRMFAITGWYHRYFSHRTFKTSRWMQFIWAVIGNSSAQRDPIWWAAHHRHHHRLSDTPGDVHSPVQRGFWWSHMLWFLSRRNFPTDRRMVRDLLAFPELAFLNRFDILVPTALGFAMFYTGEAVAALWPSLGTSGMQLLIWGFFVSTVVTAHATFTINSLSHVFGRKRYVTGDESRNNVWLALLTLGEGWHNNHHHYPNTVRQGFRWWEIDITFYGLWIMSKLGLIWDLKPVPAEVIGRDLVETPSAVGFVSR